MLAIKILFFIVVNVIFISSDESVFNHRNGTSNNKKADDPLESFTIEVQKYVRDCKSKSSSEESFERHANVNRRNDHDNNREMDDDDASFSSRQYYLNKRQKSSHSSDGKNSNYTQYGSIGSYGRRSKGNSNTNEQNNRNSNRNHNNGNNNTNRDENRNNYNNNNDFDNYYRPNSRSQDCESNSRFGYNSRSGNNDRQYTDYNNDDGRYENHHHGYNHYYNRNLYPYGSNNQDPNQDTNEQRNYRTYQGSDMGSYPSYYQGANNYYYDYQRQPGGETTKTPSYPNQFQSSSNNNWHYVSGLGRSNTPTSEYFNDNGNSRTTFDSGFYSSGASSKMPNNMGSDRFDENQRNRDDTYRMSTTNKNYGYSNREEDRDRFAFELEPPLAYFTSENSRKRIRSSQSLSSGDSNKSEENIECIPRCVFGYLEVLDENKMPSESAIIKWLQDHENDSNKRIKALRKVRKCYARLATSDIEEGCEFSRILSNCLEIEMK